MSIIADAFAAVKRELSIAFGIIDEPRERFMVTKWDQLTAGIGGLTVTEPSGKAYVFSVFDVCDVEFCSLVEQPGKVDLLIWILPYGEARYLDFQQLYAGTFEVDSEAYTRVCTLIRTLGWDLVQR